MAVDVYELLTGSGRAGFLIERRGPNPPIELLAGFSRSLFRHRTSLSVLFFVLVNILYPSDVLAEEITFEKDIQPLISHHCLPCHDAKTKDSDLNLERFNTQKDVLKSFAIWARIADKVKRREMPPAPRPEMEAQDMNKLLDWIKTLAPDYSDCDQLASEETVPWFQGYVMTRRLTRAEYSTTLRNLLNIEIDVTRLPEDGSGGEGFTNNGSTLFLSETQIKKYIEIAEAAVRSAFEKNTFGFDVQVTSSSDAEAVTRSFVGRAWRRPPTDREILRLLAAFNAEYDRSRSFAEALQFVFMAILISPHFLFLAEPEPLVQGNYPLDDYPLASRLSYFLWSSMPDDELLELARQEKLGDTVVLQQQVLRMLADPKANALGEQFALQWFGISQISQSLKPDPTLFAEFDVALASSMQKEVTEFFNYIIREDRSVIELINADYTFVDQQLAKLYGIQINDPGFIKVSWPDDSRGGILGMAAILTSTSQPNRTSPVLRGKWVLNQLLGQTVPPPPPEVPSLADSSGTTSGLTIRQQIEAHRKREECATCHLTMDNLGFGLENFDPIGRYRETDQGIPVDTLGQLPSGETFTSVKGLKELLVSRKEDFLNTLSRKVAGYAFGRSLNEYDECLIQTCISALKDNDYKPSALISTIVTSYQFRFRYSRGGVELAEAATP